MHSRIGELNPIYLQEWKIVRNYDEFVKAVTEDIDKITHISFDHDLADEHYDPSMFADDDYRYEEISNSFKEKTGYECALWLKVFYEENNKPLPTIFVHSMNPVGTQKIKQLLCV